MVYQISGKVQVVRRLRNGRFFMGGICLPDTVDQDSVLSFTSGLIFLASLPVFFQKRRSCPL
jgi:hypothetical protein